ncbi:hypothetical protein KA001_00805 [Patescibacteria group bacterium]|nr:hypothetical protein [Patescibacteria group bacterium]
MSIIQAVARGAHEFYDTFVSGTPVGATRTPQQTQMFTEIKHVSVNGIQQQMIQACNAYSEALKNDWVSSQELTFLLSARDKAIQDFYSS